MQNASAFISGEQKMITHFLKPEYYLKTKFNSLLFSAYHQSLIFFVKKWKEMAIVKRSMHKSAF